MKKRTYTPRPFDSSGIKLPEDLKDLSEMMARNTHEVWAAERIRQGWKWGPERNDTAKEHPDLIPYEDLSEEEKQYDRHTSEETLKLVISLGYSISKKLRQ